MTTTAATGQEAAASAFAEHERETVALASEVLSRMVSAPVELEQVKSFRGPSSRATVIRCAVRSSANAPKSVIVKRFRQEGGGPYDAAETTRYSDRGRFISEWSGLRFVHGREESRTFAPAPLAADADRGTVVLEDLGEGECLADVLQADDSVAAEAALTAYADTLGRLHAATAGRRAELLQVRAAAAGTVTVEGWSATGGFREEALPAFRKALAAMDVALPEVCEVELEQVAGVIERPGPFDAFSVSDTCPDNHRYARADPVSGTSGYLRFFDFEFCAFRHALIDAAYLWMPFPTCWCVNRLPDSLPERLTTTYRQALATGWPAAEDEAQFGRGLAASCIYWLVTTLGWNLEPALREDSRWGIATVRQRHPLRAQNVTDLCARYGQFPGMAAFAGELAVRLRERWGAEGEMPLYPAFRAA